MVCGKYLVNCCYFKIDFIKTSCFMWVFYLYAFFSEEEASPFKKNLQKYISEIQKSSFLFFFNWSIVDLQYCANLCCTAKWLSYIHTFFMVYYRVLNIIPVLYINTLLFIHSKDRSLYLPTPHSQSIPLPQPQPLWQPQVWSTSLLLFGK